MKHNFVIALCVTCFVAQPLICFAEYVPITRLLNQGYEIKAGQISEHTTLWLQKKNSAYQCSNTMWEPNPDPKGFLKELRFDSYSNSLTCIEIYDFEKRR